jgi:hypothetical protein
MPTAPKEKKTPPAGREIIEREISDLLLDPRNPRLVLNGTSASQDAILRKMYKEEALEELALSFARNGFFWEEPLVVVPSGKADDKFVVVEGNRRLAALKLLTDAALRKKVGVTEFPDASAQREKELQSVPTVTYPTRDSIVPYLGFRHITGVKTWEPFAKARYVSELINSGLAISQIEQSIGDSARTVKKLYQTYIVYGQIATDLDIEPKEIRENFSLLEVALGQQAIKEFLGVPRELPKKALDAIVPKERLERLRELVSWVFGDSATGKMRVISESRQIPSRLAPVIADEEAYQYLQTTRDLEGAYERSGGERQYVVKQLIAAGRSVERALGVISLYKGDPEIVGQVERLDTLIGALGREARA